ncbi:oligosaccharide flippase family protein [Halopseudomonas xiamenensis]|uniref:oligosaccharide flippase family protein n=1 Tax=Halopseudomonas xiamenensis TaxID=157792 RepID=UPI001625FBBA|nr:oligosaccharide flippase family protein [Halopseudomonas xiamenensis]
MSSNQYLRHLLFSMGTRLLMVVLRLLRNVLLARLLGPADRGIFALLAALPDLIAAFSSGGLNTAVSYQAARQKPIGLLLAQILVYGCLLATLLTLAGLILVQQFGFATESVLTLGTLLWLLLLAVPLTVLKTSLLVLHNACGQVGPFNALRLLESSLPLLLFIGFWLLWQDTPLDAALVSWLGGLMAVVVIGWCWLARFHNLQLRWDTREQKALLLYSSRSHPDALCQQLLLRGDYLLIGLMLDPAALGYYAMASAAAELLLIIPEAVTTPLMKRLLQQGQDVRRLTPLALRVTATVMLLACIGMALFGYWLIILLFGHDYAPAYPALLALLPGLLGLCYASILRLDLLGKRRPGSLSLMMGAGVVLNLTLNLLLIPTLGIVGAAIASSAAYLTVTGMMLFLYCRLNDTPLWQTLILLPDDVATLLRLLRGKESTC